MPSMAFPDGGARATTYLPCLVVVVKSCSLQSLIDKVRVRVWFNYYAFLGEMTMRYNTEPQAHTHFYEGKFPQPWPFAVAKCL
jgi:hypothetical protein